MLGRARYSRFSWYIDKTHFQRGTGWRKKLMRWGQRPTYTDVREYDGVVNHTRRVRFLLLWEHYHEFSSHTIRHLSSVGRQCRRALLFALLKGSQGQKQGCGQLELQIWRLWRERGEGTPRPHSGRWQNSVPVPRGGWAEVPVFLPSAGSLSLFTWRTPAFLSHRACPIFNQRQHPCLSMLPVGLNSSATPVSLEPEKVPDSKGSFDESGTT